MAVANIDPNRIPKHVACVMDGNGRWARQRGLARTEGHAAGEEAMFDTVEGALELGLGWLTMFAFSTENWRRPPDEVRYLMNFNEGILTAPPRRPATARACGSASPAGGTGACRAASSGHMDESMELTAANRRLTLTICFNYGGRAEIVDAVRQLVADGVPADKIDEKALRSRLYFPDMPDPDLVIRTSGEFRISNFLLWELAYSELVFTDVLWPDFRRENLFDAVARVPAPRPALRRGRTGERRAARRAVPDPRPHRSHLGPVPRARIALRRSSWSSRSSGRRAGASRCSSSSSSGWS